jgi:hypothetical protein
MTAGAIRCDGCSVSGSSSSSSSMGLVAAAVSRAGVDAPRSQFGGNPKVGEFHLVFWCLVFGGGFRDVRCAVWLLGACLLYIPHIDPTDG